MWIDNINFVPVEPQSGLLGFASVNLFFNHQESIYIGNIGVYSNRYNPNYRITFPTRKSKRGNQISIVQANPKLAKKIKDKITKEVKNHFQNLYLGDEDE